jgi:hypothetical protein
MTWKGWLKTARENQLRIIDWPGDVQPPGPGFAIRGIGTMALRILVGDYIEYKLNGGSMPIVPKIEKWTEGSSKLHSNFNLTYIHYSDEKAIPIYDAEKGSIPLVVAIDGKILRTLANCPDWIKLYNKSRRAQRSRNRGGGMAFRDLTSDSESSAPAIKVTKKANQSSVDRSDPSGLESDADDPGPSQRKTKHHHISKKRSHSHMSDQDSDDDATPRERKRGKGNREKQRGRHHHNHQYRKNGQCFNFLFKTIFTYVHTPLTDARDARGNGKGKKKRPTPSDTGTNSDEEST